MAVTDVSVSMPPVNDDAQPSVILNSVEISLGIVGLVGNVLVSLTILLSESLHGLTNYLVLNLAIADSLVCVTGITNLWLLYRFDPCSQDTIPVGIVMIYSYIQKSVTGQSVFSLLLVTFERYMGIIHSLRHRNYFQRRKVIILLLFVWATPLTLEAWPTMWLTFQTGTPNCTGANALVHFYKYKQHPVTIAYLVYTLLRFAVPAAAMIWMYVKILKSLKQNSCSMEQLGIQGPPKELHRAKTRVVHTLLLITVAFFGLIVPEKIICLVLALSNIYGVNFFVEIQVTFILVLANSAINPFLYTLKYDKFQRAMRSTLCPWSGASIQSHEAVDAEIEMQSIPASQQDS